MGENAMVESKINDTVRLIQQLDEDGISPSLVVWYFYADVDDWRLLIAGLVFDELLPKQEPIAYRKIIEVMAKLSLASLSVSDLKLVSTHSPLPQAILFLIRTGPTGITQAHFIDTTLNGIFIKEMIILRSA
jgi:hypothetical protein